MVCLPHSIPAGRQLSSHSLMQLSSLSLMQQSSHSLMQLSSHSLMLVKDKVRKSRFLRRRDHEELEKYQKLCGWVPALHRVVVSAETVAVADSDVAPRSPARTRAVRSCCKDVEAGGVQGHAALKAGGEVDPRGHSAGAGEAVSKR